MKKFFHKLIHFSFIATSFLYCIAALSPYIHPKYFFAFCFTSIGFPLLLFAMLGFCFYHLFFSKKKSLICFFILLLGYKNISTNIGFRFSNKTNTTNSIKLLSWNVRDFKELLPNGKFNLVPEKHFDFIKHSNADIVCLQDVSIFVEKDKPTFVEQIASICNYPFYYYSIDVDSLRPNYSFKEQYGTCIFSKYPITFSNHINYEGKSFTESLAYADIDIKGKKIRVYNTHLKSMYIKIKPDQTQANFPYVIDDTNLVFHSNPFEKIKAYDLIHVKQAEKIKSVLDTTTTPFVFCGDVNSTPSSYVYHTLKKDLQDAYLNHNWGWQNTYTSRIPSMRIDLILMSKNLITQSYFSPRFTLSDHYPSVCEFSVKD